MKHKDENALYILENKHSISKILLNNDDLPEVSDDVAKKIINDVETFIKEINPCVESKRNNYVTSYVKYINYDVKTPCLKGRKYLKNLPRYLLESVVYYYNVSNYIKMSDEELIDTICNHKDFKNMMIAFIKKRKGVSFPLYVIEYFKSGDYEIKA